MKELPTSNLCVALRRVYPFSLQEPAGLAVKAMCHAAADEIDRLQALATQLQRDNSALIGRLAKNERAADEIEALTRALHETQQGWAADQNARASAETGDDDEPVAQLVVIKAGDRHHFGWMTYRTPPVGTYQLYLRPAEKAVETGGVLAELKDWATYWSSAPPDDAGSRGWRFAAQEVLQKIQRAAKAVETTSPQLPIARVVIREDEPPGLQMYAPGLPPGAHELYCEPEAVAPYVRAEKAAESRHPCGCLVGTICPHRHAGSMCDGLITDPETGLKSVCPECYSKKATTPPFDPLRNFAEWVLGAHDCPGMVEHIIDNARGALEEAGFSEKTESRCLVANCNKPPLTGAFCEEHNETVGGICGTAVDLKPAADVDDEHDAPDFTLPCANCGRPLEEHIGVVCPVPRDER